MVWRHPFPGPGLAVRCLCASPSDASIADVFGGVEPSILGYQIKALPVKSVGVQGDVRSYKNPACVIGGEKNWANIANTSTTITNKYAELNRAVYLLSPDNVETATLSSCYLTPERISLLQEADKIVMDFIYEKGLEKAVWQFPTVLVPLSVNGVYGETIVLRPVESEEAMTANFYQMDFELLEELVERLKAVKGVSAIMYDVTNKPPATIEWE